MKKLNIPFRNAHSITGNIVKKAEELNIGLEEIPLNILQHFCKDINENIYSFISLDASLNNRTSFGGTATENVKKMIEFYKNTL